MWAQSAAWLSAHTLNNPLRTEGVFEEQNARLEYEVRGFEAFGDPNHPGERRQEEPALRIGYCRSSAIDPDDSKNKKAFIEVRPNRSDLNENYIMKAQQPPQGSDHAGWNTFSWPTRDVIRRNDINTNDLSVVIHMGADDNFAENIQPAMFTAIPSEQAPQTAPPRINGYLLSLLIQRDALKSLAYTYSSGSGPAKTCYYLNEHQPCLNDGPRKPPPMIEEGTVVKLRMDMSEMPEGMASVHIRGTYALIKDTLDVTFRFIHVRTCH
jgi:hypothetical protein